MKQYLLTIYQPDGDPPPPAELDAIMRDVAAFEDELRAAGAWVFSGGLHDADHGDRGPSEAARTSWSPTARTWRARSTSAACW